jgi:nicotinamide phosphoribosyltransferase
MLNLNQKSILTFIASNPILNTDSYKPSHYKMLTEGCTTLVSYIEARGGIWDETVFFGLQAYNLEYLTRQITRQNIEDAAWFFSLHGEPFNREGWEYILEKYDGYLPLRVRAVKEGSVIPTKNILVSVENTDEKCAWLTSYIEPTILRGTWYGTTISTQSWNIKQLIKGFMNETCDNIDGLPWKLHDFGARGVSSLESAVIAGAAHLVNFRGSDTISGALGAMLYYGEPDKVPSDSIPATEHSVMTILLKKGEFGQILRALRQFGKPGGLFACVSDSYNIDEAVKYICSPEFQAELKEIGAKIVIRPDSGDPVEMSLRIVRMIDELIGTTTNSKGYKVLPANMGVIYGDGINKTSIRAILFNLKIHGYSTDCINFGMGGALLQNVTRDDQCWAMKACAAEIDSIWVDVKKEPVTDTGKVSKAGRMSLFRSRLTGEYRTIRTDSPIDSEWVDQMQTVFENGKIMNLTTFTEIRDRANDPRKSRDELEAA